MSRVDLNPPIALGITCCNCSQPLIAVAIIPSPLQLYPHIDWRHEDHSRTCTVTRPAAPRDSLNAIRLVQTHAAALGKEWRKGGSRR